MCKGVEGKIVELEQLTEFRFYKLLPTFPTRCTNIVENIYERKTGGTKTCHGLLTMHMVDNSVNLRCPHVGCFKEYEIPRVCSACGREHLFEDITCDTCEPIVINIATWKVSIAECNKAIKKINRAFKQNLIPETEWKSALKIQQDELVKCEKELDKLDL
jgi:hypothetical protein